LVRVVSCCAHVLGAVAVELGLQLASDEGGHDHHRREARRHSTAAAALPLALLLCGAGKGKEKENFNWESKFAEADYIYKY
jgi:hypothetical protein